MCDGLGSSLAALFGVLPNTFFQPERRTGYDDKGCKPHGTCVRSRSIDSLRTVS